MKSLTMLLLILVPLSANANFIAIVSCIHDANPRSVVTVQLPGPILIYQDCNQSSLWYREGVRRTNPNEYVGASSSFVLDKDTSIYILDVKSGNVNLRVNFDEMNCDTGGTTSNPVTPKTCK